MYSVVLMAALTTTPAVPDFGRRGGCWGGSACCGCYGGGYGCAGYGCWGGRGCSGCYGYGCSGCSGCWGGYGYGCYGCSGGYSYPAYASYGCSGSYANYGGYYGGYGFGCSGGGYAFGYAPAYIGQPTGPGPNRPAEKIPGPGKSEGSTASIKVDLPAGAKLFVDGKLTDTKSSAQTFTTPDLSPGQMYAYTFRAEVVQNGQKRSDTRRVVFRPGESLRVSFPGLTNGGTQTAQASKR